MSHIITSLEDLIYKRPRFFLLLSLLFIFFSISFKFDSGGSSWIWNDHPYIPFLMVVLAIIIVLVWLNRVQEQLRHMQDQIRHQNPTVELLSKLSTRQKEVFDHIVAGKSNKEITQSLHIELSTLKTHINHIYKTLDIKNRKEARQLGATTDPH